MHNTVSLATFTSLATGSTPFAEFYHYATPLSAVSIHIVLRNPSDENGARSEMCLAKLSSLSNTFEQFKSYCRKTIKYGLTFIVTLTVQCPRVK